MSTLNNGGPAFPYVGQQYKEHGTGMTLRDYFAAKALAAVFTDAMAEAREGSGLFQDPDWREGIALDAYKYADAMLAERQKAYSQGEG